MSRDFPTRGDEPTLTIGGVVFPLAFDTDYVRQPMVPLPGSSAIGDASKQEDLLIPTFVISQWVNGVGLLQYDASQGVLAVTDATLDLRNPNGVVCLPGATLLGGVADPAAYNPWHIEVLASPSDGVPKLFCWSVEGEKVIIFNLNTGAEILAHTNMWEVNAFVDLGDTYYATSNGSIGLWTSTDGVTWTNLDAAHGYLALVAFDDLLYAYRAADNTTYAIQPSPFVATAVVAPPLLGNTELPRQLFVYKDLIHGGDTVFMLTTRRVRWAELETQEWHTFGPPYDRNFTTLDPFVCVWDRDGNAYLSFYPDGALLLQDNAGTQDEVGPTKQGGLPAQGALTTVAFVVQSIHWLYALAPDLSGVGGGRIMAMGEEQGWSTVYAAPASDPIVGFGYRAGTGYVLLTSGALYALHLPDIKGPLPTATPGDYSTALGFVEFPWIDFGTETRWDIAKWVVLEMTLPDGSFGVPPGSTLYIEYRYDSAPWRRIDVAVNAGESVAGTLLTESVAAGTAVFPLVIPLPDPEVQTGVACHRLKLRVWMQRTSAATSPCLKTLQVAYLPWDEQRYSYQFLIDLTDERFSDQPGRMYAGRGQEELKAILLQYAKDKRTYPVSFGAGAQATTLVGADFLVSSREDPAGGSALLSVSFRDVSAPDSG